MRRPSLFDTGLLGDAGGSACSLLLFVHRVQGLPAGLYMLIRDMQQLDALQAGLSPAFGWSLCAPKQDEETGVITGARAIPRGPERAVEVLQLLASGVLPLFCLAVGDVQEYAQQAFCHQDVACDGTFSVAMIAPIGRPFESEEARGRAYRESHWECGVIGQTLYLAAEGEQRNFHGTGLGCFFDDAIHQVLGINPGNVAGYQCLYGFSVGAGLVGELNDDDVEDGPRRANLNV